MGVDTCPYHSIIIIIINIINHHFKSYNNIISPCCWALAASCYTSQQSRDTLSRCHSMFPVRYGLIRRSKQTICYHQGDGYHPSFLTSKQCWPTMQPSWLYSPCSQAPSQHRFHSTDFLLVWVASCHCHHGVMLSCIGIN